MATLEPGASFSHPRADIKSGRVKERGSPCAKQRMASCLCDLEAICFNWACLGFHELMRVPLQILIRMIIGTAIKVMMENPSSLRDEKKVQTSHLVSRNSEAKHPPVSLKHDASKTTLLRLVFRSLAACIFCPNRAPAFPAQIERLHFAIFCPNRSSACISPFPGQASSARLFSPSQRSAFAVRPTPSIQAARSQRPAFAVRPSPSIQAARSQRLVFAVCPGPSIQAARSQRPAFTVRPGPSIQAARSQRPAFAVRPGLSIQAARSQQPAFVVRPGPSIQAARSQRPAFAVHPGPSIQAACSQRPAFAVRPGPSIQAARSQRSIRTRIYLLQISPPSPCSSLPGPAPLLRPSV
ncbi:hypothetical protein ACLOJK_037841 [Asimina triloba]